MLSAVAFRTAETYLDKDFIALSGDIIMNPSEQRIKETQKRIPSFNKCNKNNINKSNTGLTLLPLLQIWILETEGDKELTQTRK